MNLLKIDDLYKQRVLLYMYKSDLTHAIEPNHNFSTRNAYNIIVPRFNLSRSQSTIFYKGIVLWNNLPENIKTIRSESKFKSSVKTILINDYWIKIKIFKYIVINTSFGTLDGILELWLRSMSKIF